MAEQNAEFVQREIKLNEEFIGERRLRYIYFYYPNVVSTERKESSDCTPLFLGADVLLGCNISHNNLPRVHAKHAKRGLATKVNFPAGHKVLGIHGTIHGVWFYSIQGIFKIVFDYYSREEQQQCLDKLQKIWLRQILDPVLTKEVHVVVRENTAQSFELQDGRNTDCKTTDAVELVDKIKKNIDGYLLKTGNECLKQELGLLLTYTCFMDAEKNTDSFVNGAVNLLKNCLVLLPLISEKSVGFSEKETILCEVARWLGTEFANYHAHVNESVTAFKQKHIRCVENLPSAEVLVSEVFPSSMQTLLRCWLRVGDDAEKQNATNAERSRDSVTEAVPSLTLFPVVQLILELANQNLLSGVAHVLYSRLIQSESV